MNLLMTACESVEYEVDEDAVRTRTTTTTVEEHHVVPAPATTTTQETEVIRY